MTFIIMVLTISLVSAGTCGWRAVRLLVRSVVRVFKLAAGPPRALLPGTLPTARLLRYPSPSTLKNTAD